MQIHIEARDACDLIRLVNAVQMFCIKSFFERVLLCICQIVAGVNRVDEFCHGFDEKSPTAATAIENDRQYVASHPKPGRLAHILHDTSRRKKLTEFFPANSRVQKCFKHAAVEVFVNAV